MTFNERKSSIDGILTMQEEEERERKRGSRSITHLVISLRIFAKQDREQGGKTTERVDLLAFLSLSAYYHCLHLYKKEKLREVQISDAHTSIVKEKDKKKDKSE